MFFLSHSEFNLHYVPQVENDFILPLEKEVFIEQLKDIVDKAEDMLSEDTEGEKNSEQAGGPKQTEAPGILGTEVRTKLLQLIVTTFLVWSLPVWKTLSLLHSGLLVLHCQRKWMIIPFFLIQSFNAFFYLCSAALLLVVNIGLVDANGSFL